MIAHSPPAAPTRNRATSFDRLLRRRQADPQHPVAGECGKPLEATRPDDVPRLFAATAWISSTMTVRVVASIARPDIGAEQDVERFRRGDDDMRRAAAHLLALARPAYRRYAPSCGSRHPADLVRATPRESRRAALRDCGGCRSTTPSTARRRRFASRRGVRPPALAGPARRSPREKRRGSCRSRSGPRSEHRRPAWIAGQASACAAVGAAKLRSNQAATAG